MKGRVSFDGNLVDITFELTEEKLGKDVNENVLSFEEVCTFVNGIIELGAGEGIGDICVCFGEGARVVIGLNDGISGFGDDESGFTGLDSKGSAEVSIGDVICSLGGSVGESGTGGS